jgi:hypothetical protein
MIKSIVEVIPNDNVDISKSILQHFTSKFTPMKTDVPISLDSKTSIPIFRLSLADNYGNMMLDFAGAQESAFSLQIIGDIFTTANPVILE